MRESLNAQTGMADEDWSSVVEHLKVVHVPKKTVIQAAGETVSYHYFLCDGLVRFYYPTRDGKELNKGFYGENYIVGSLSAVILKEPARFSVETLEACTLIELPLNNFHDLYLNAPSWQRLYNHSCQMMLVRNERREAELLTLSAKQRYLQFSRNFPDYLTRIPQYHIASYLGITPEALSKYKQQWLEFPE